MKMLEDDKTIPTEFIWINMGNLKLEIQSLWVLKILVHCSIIQVMQFEWAISKQQKQFTWTITLCPQSL